MPSTTIQTSFAAGELSPNLFARVDLDQYKIGAALLRNFFVDFRGGASTRAGTQFGCRVRSAAKARLLPFVVAEIRAYVIEAGDHYFRFISDNQQVVEATKTITGVSNASPGVVTAVAHGYSLGDEVVLVGIVGMPRLNTRNFLVGITATDTFELLDLDGNPIDTTMLGAYVSGGTAARVYTLASPYAGADLPLLKYVQSADVLTLTHPNYPVQQLTRTSPSVFTLAPLFVGATISSPSDIVGVATVSGTDQYGYVVTALDKDGIEESLPSDAAVVIGATLNMLYAPSGGGPSDSVINLSWDAPGTQVSQYNIYKWGPTPGPTSAHPSLGGTVYGYIGQSMTTSFCDTNIAPDFTHVPPQFQDPFSVGQVAYVDVTDGGFGFVSINYSPMVFSGDGTGAAGYGVIDIATGKVVSVVVTQPGKNYTTCTATMPGGGGTGATFSVNLGAFSGTYPSCCTYFQQRQCFGGPTGNPQGIVMSQTGNYSNFDTTPVSIASDAITISLANREENLIKSMVSMPTGLVVFTSGGATLISGGGKGDAVTPASIVALPQASIGANDMPPIQINYDILYVQSKGSIVRDLAFSFYLQSYEGTDRSALSNHLFFGHELLEWALAHEPFRTIWVVRADGVALSLTYVVEEKVFAWAHHDTAGLFQSVCSIPEENSNVLYFIVRRFIQGAWVQYIERMDTRIFSSVVDAWSVDAGLRYTLATPNATLTTSATSGAAAVYADNAVFGAGDVGSIIWLGGGQFSIEAFVSPTQVTGTFLTPISAVVANVSPPLAVPVEPGAWSYGHPISRVFGLDHLIGQTVTGLADGDVIAPQVVASDGSITLLAPATKIIVGLSYQCQLETLKLDIASQETTQTKRKFQPAATLRVDKTRGLQAGVTFDALVPLKDPVSTPIGIPVELVSGDIRTLLPNIWAESGSICVQQDFPLPATLLGIIREVVVGDTQR